MDMDDKTKLNYDFGPHALQLAQGVIIETSTNISIAGFNFPTPASRQTIVENYRRLRHLMRELFPHCEEEDV